MKEGSIRLCLVDSIPWLRIAICRQRRKDVRKRGKGFDNGENKDKDKDKKPVSILSFTVMWMIS